MTKFALDADFLHPAATVERSSGRTGVHITFPNGWVVSVQWGPGTYSSNYERFDLDYRSPAPDADKAEIAAWKGEGGLIEWPDGDTVQGWQTWDDVQRVLDAAENDSLPSREKPAQEPWQSGTYVDVGNINFPPGQDDDPQAQGGNR